MKALEKIKITVMLGGPSAEREVSLRSGVTAAKALRSLGHEVQEVDPQNGKWTLPGGTQVVFLALHGTYGEDGTVQRRLEELGVPCTGCDPEASRIGFDKYLTKERLVAAGVPTARFTLIDSAQASWPIGWNPPVVLKPARQGSSVGLQFVERVADWGKALAEAIRYDSQVLMEEKIAGRECTVGILAEAKSGPLPPHPPLQLRIDSGERGAVGGEGQTLTALPILEVQPKAGVYDYQTKYTPGTTDYFCPGRFDEATTERIQAAALGAFKAIGGR